MIRTIVVATLVASCAALGWACSEDRGGILTLEEYFESFQEFDDEYRDRVAELDEEVREDPSVDEAVDGFEEFGRLTEKFIDRVDMLNPPQEIEDTHDDLVGATRAALEQLEDLSDDLRGADSLEEASTMIDEADSEEGKRSITACKDLEQVAAENDIEVDLFCAEE